MSDHQPTAPVGFRRLAAAPKSRRSLLAPASPPASPLALRVLRGPTAGAEPTAAPHAATQLLQPAQAAAEFECAVASAQKPWRSFLVPASAPASPLALRVLRGPTAGAKPTAAHHAATQLLQPAPAAAEFECAHCAVASAQKPWRSFLVPASAPASPLALRALHWAQTVGGGGG